MPSREDVFKKIAGSSLFGDLGLFIGGGFSKSVMNKKETIALSWGDLIYKSLFDLKIDITEVHREGLSYPELASQICHILSNREKISFEEAVDRLKNKLADITNWYPTEKSGNEFGEFLRTIMPQWIITTNYDLILECLLPGMCITLGPEEQLFIPKKLIPVYHIHGIRTNPKSMVVTQEDYIRLFRPNEYRQSKLSLTLKESTTLFIGYGLGDINVLSAVDWAHNVFRGENHNSPPDIIQILVIESSPKKEVYLESNGTMILEVNNLSTFFRELCKYIEESKKADKGKTEDLKKIKKYLHPSDGMIDDFVNDSSFRIELLKRFAALDPFHLSGLLILITRASEKLWESSNPENIIPFLTDFLIHPQIAGSSPAVMEMIISNLNKLGKKIEKKKDLIQIWTDNKKHIPPPNLEEMIRVSKNLNYKFAVNLLNQI